MKIIQRPNTLRLIVMISCMVTALPLSNFAQSVDFETITASKDGAGGFALVNQLPGLVFGNATVLDFSDHPGFARSGKNAIEICYGKEFCGGGLTIQFNALQTRVSMWAGFAGLLKQNRMLTLRAFDKAGVLVASKLVPVGPVIMRPPSNYTSVRWQLEVKTALPLIDHITAGFTDVASGGFNTSLVFDDLEFSDPGGPPPCISNTAPLISMVTPIEGLNVLENVFSVNANITTPYVIPAFPATGTITTTSDDGNTKTFGPVFLTSNTWLAGGITNFLFPGRNTVQFTVTDCAGSAVATRTVFYRPEVVSSFIHVIDQNAHDVPGAEVYADGKLIGKADAAGKLTVIPALKTGTILVARALVYQNKPDPAYDYHIYITSMAITNTGNAVGQPVTLSTSAIAEQTLQVLPTNTQVGIRVRASVEFDAAAAELNDIGEHFKKASAFLYNATDGQLYFERVDIQDDSKGWEGADFHIYGDKDYWSMTDWHWDFADAREEMYVMNLPRPEQIAVDNEFSRFETYMHEFGHYEFHVMDEYEDPDGNVAHCTVAGAISGVAPVTPFQQGMPAAACIMDWQVTSPKFCSNHPANPHVKSTEQGDEACWTAIGNTFNDGNQPKRWLLQSPETRGAIPGLISGGNLPIDGLLTKLAIVNHSRGTLCAPMFLSVVDERGAPVKNAEITLHTFYGQRIIEGRTNPGTAVGFWATGIHPADKVGNLSMTGCAVAPLSTTVPLTASAGTSISSGIQLITLSDAVLSTRFSVAATGNSGKLAIRVTSQKPLTQPVLSLISTGSAERIGVSLAPTRAATSLQGTVTFKKEGEATLLLSFGKKNKTEQVAASFIVREAHGKTLRMQDSRHHMQVNFPAASLPAKTRVVLGPSPNIGPRLTKDETIWVGPVQISSSVGEKPRAPFTAIFNLGQGVDSVGATSVFNPASVKLLHYNGVSWQPVASTWVKGPGPLSRVVAKLTEMGSYCVTVTRK